MANNYVYTRSKPYMAGQLESFKISRSKIELYMQCQRCFWLDVRLKIKRPSGPPFQINKAIDTLLKKEFDSYRIQQLPHPWMTDNQIKAIPFSHAELDKWRHNFTGVSHLHEMTNLIIYGAIDDVWIGEDGKLIVVDYKATAKNGEVNLDADWQVSYKRQMEVYQWLLRRNGFEVNDTAYFVYANGRLDAEGFYDRVDFRTIVIPYIGDDAWLEPTLRAMKDCLEGGIPEVGMAAMGGPCDFCTYAKARTELTLSAIKNRK